MGSRTYLATGVFLRAMERVLGINIRVSGAEHLAEQPLLFVVNHFTRFETMIIPYVTHRYLPGQLRSLADDALFKGVFGRYLASCGVMSVREPLRNRTIIRDLVTGQYNWVIYPEGLMMKDKKILGSDRLTLNFPDRHASPHTGAAMLALKAEISKRQYLAAVDSHDTEKMEHYESRYAIESPDAVCRDDVLMVPVNITYYPLRPDTNILNRVAKWIQPELSARVEEELQVEGTILLGDSDMSIHFGQPIRVADYLDRPTQWLRRLAGLFSKPLETDLLLGRQANRLTADAMEAIYIQTEINFDHLFCYGLFALKHDAISIDQMHRALYVCALELRKHDDLRLHPHLLEPLIPLLTGAPFEPLESVIALATEYGLVRIENERYVLDRTALTEAHDFHAVRVDNTVQVIANEFESIKEAVSVVKRIVNLEDQALKQRVSQGVAQVDRRVFHRDYHQVCLPGECSPVHVGEPFFLEAPGSKVGVVLVHGYLSAPQEVRPMAEYLHERGLTVYGVRLEGHGTTPEAMTQVKWQDWIRSLVRGDAAVRHTCERVIVGGFSLGGVLSLCLAATHRQAVDGVFSINAPMKLRDRRTKMIPAILWWNKLATTMRLPQASYRSISNKNTENPGINYEVNYLRGTRQLQLAVAACRKQLDQVTAPALIVQADADPLVHPDSAHILYDNIASTNKGCAEMEFDRHVIIRGDGSEKVFERVGEFIDCVAQTV